jgi:hypothetical protein
VLFGAYLAKQLSKLQKTDRAVAHRKIFDYVSDLLAGSKYVLTGPVAQEIELE